MMTSASHPMLPAHLDDRVILPAGVRPRLVVIVDAEEEFDWTAPFSRSNHSVYTIKAQILANHIFERFGIVPTYAVDYPVASQPEGYLPLQEMMQSGRCEIGAQLHTWVTPPFEEDVNEINSFASNLPVELERQKLIALTNVIERNFGRKPKLYRAGRYGAGCHTAALLEELGYEIDCSVLPGGPTVALGPDYSGGTSHLYWLGQKRSILEIPVTVGTLGLVRDFGDTLYGKLISPLGRKFRVPAIMARLGIMERIRLTPEGSTLAESKRLTRQMLEDGHRVFAISYHSPSLVPGHTQYVQNEKDLQTFLGWIEGYLEFFFGELRGEAATPGSIREWAMSYAPPRKPVMANEMHELRELDIKTPPRVSVVIPAHNSAATLGRALDSVLGQTLPPLETIVVDDCSSDDTVALAQTYAQHGVRVVALTERSGAAGARNAGIVAAAGDYIAFLDSDDEWLPEKMARQMPLLESNARVTFVSCCSNLFAPDGRDLGDTYRGHRPTTGIEAWKALLDTNFVATPTVVARREKLLSLGNFDRSLKIGEDQDMWIRLALAGELGFVHESLVRVHQRVKSLSNWELGDQLRYTLPMIERHVAALADRLTHGEVRAIRGERIGRMGRVAYATDQRFTGLKMILQSMLLGNKPLESVYYLANASPPVVWLKRRLRGEGSR